MKNKILTLLLSLAISFGLWLYVVTVISPESETTIYNVPVELVRSDYLDSHGLIIVSPTEGLKVNLTLEGSRSDLNKLNNSNVTVIADLSQITKSGEHQLSCSVSYQSGTAEVLAQDPERITIVVADRETKIVPVKPKFDGAVPNGYEADRENVAMDHATVTVTGPKETVDKITSAMITIDLTGKMSTFAHDYPLTLCGADNQPIADDSFVTVNLEEIRAVVQVYQMKRVPVQTSEDYTGSGLQENTASVDLPSKIRDHGVTLIGSSEALAKVEDLLLIPIVMRDYNETTTIVWTPELPDGVHCKETIEIEIGIPEMDERVFTVDVTQFKSINVPDGMTVQVTEPFEVTIRGPKEILDQISDADIIGTVDCSNVTATSVYAPVVYTVEGYEYLYIRGVWETVFIEVTHTEN
jgi:YbbR domain-containing protein